MKEISLRQYGPAITNINVAQTIYQQIAECNPGECEVTIDFDGVEAMTTQCAKAIFGKLYKELGADVFYANLIYKSCSEGLKIVIELGIESVLNLG